VYRHWPFDEVAEKAANDEFGVFILLGLGSDQAVGEKVHDSAR
jgi:hypothetical protein